MEAMRRSFSRSSIGHVSPTCSNTWITSVEMMMSPRVMYSSASVTVFALCWSCSTSGDRYTDRLGVRGFLATLMICVTHAQYPSEYEQLSESKTMQDCERPFKYSSVRVLTLACVYERGLAVQGYMYEIACMSYVYCELTSLTRGTPSVTFFALTPA